MAKMYLVELECYLGGTSSTSNDISLGSKTWALTAGSPVPTYGMTLRAESAADPANYVEGTVSEASKTSVTINIKKKSGTGAAITSWKFTNGTLRYCSGLEYNNPTAPGLYEPAIAPGGAVQTSQSLFGDGKTFGAAEVSKGFIKVINGGGIRDHIRKYAFNGYPARILIGDSEQVYNNFSVFLTGTVEQPVVSRDDILFRFRDRIQELETPVQSIKYLGNNTLPNGVEGVEADLKDRNKPLLRGYAFNFSPPLVNTSKLIYQISHKQIHGIEWVKDGGVPLTRGMTRATLNDLLNTAPAATNTFDLYLGSASDGAYIRLGSTPARTLTLSAWEGATAADRTVAQLWKRILISDAGYQSTDFISADITALDAAAPYEAGIWIGTEETTVKNAIDSLCQSIRGWYAADENGKWRIGQISIPTGTPVRSFKYFTSTTVATLSEANIVDLELVASNDDKRGLPASRVNVEWGRNYTPQNATDLGGDPSKADDPVGGMSYREMLKKEFSTVSYPADGQSQTVLSKWKVPVELTFPSLLRYRTDAATVALQYYSIYSVLRDRFRLTVNLNQSNLVATRLGSIIRVQANRYGLEDGKLFIVLGAEPNPETGVIVLDIWGAET